MRISRVLCLGTIVVTSSDCDNRATSMSKRAVFGVSASEENRDMESRIA